MFSRLNLRQILIILFAVCLTVRLGFVIGKRQAPVMWDARIYSSAAVGLIYYLENGGQFGHPEKYSSSDSAFQQAQFDTYLNQYINGEQIEWLYYGKPSIAAAQEYIFISGPLLPAYLAAIFWQNIFPDFVVVRFINAIIDSFCLVLLFLIADSLFGRKSALLAGLLYIIYLPFILLSGIVSPDPITIFLILLSLYLILLWYRNRTAKYLYLCGLTLGLLVLAKPTASLLFVPFLIGFLYEHRADLKNGLALISKASLPFLAVTLPWVIITSLYYGQPAVRDPHYSEANFRSSSSIKYEGYDLDYAERDFWIYPVSYTISHDPGGYAKLLVKKFVRLWSKPFNDFRQSFIITPDISAIIHLVIVISALFGIFYYSFGSGTGYIYLLLVPLYYTFVHVIFHSLARYNLNPMPLLVIASSGILIKALGYFWRAFSSPKKIHRLLGIILSLAGGIFILSIPTKLFVDFFGPVPGKTLSLILSGLILLAILIYLGRLVYPSIGFAKAFCVTAIPGIILFAVSFVIGSTPENWAEWKYCLDNSDQAAGARIYIPKSFRIAPKESPGIRVDLLGVRGAENKFQISINGYKSVFSVGQPPISSKYYRKATYAVFEKMLDVGKEEIRHWSYFELSSSVFSDFVQRDGFIDIQIGPLDSGSLDKPITLFGNHPLTGADSASIPDLNRSSSERFIDKGDPRVWINYPLSSDSVISYFISDKKLDQVTKDDLSPVIGKQTGRYRIYIEIERYDKSVVYF